MQKKWRGGAKLVDRYTYVPCDLSVLKHAQTRGCGGMVPQENFDFYDLRDCFWWLLRLYTQTKKVNCTCIHLIAKSEIFPHGSQG